MKIAAIDVFTVRLPFRFSFGHSLAKRCSSENVVVRVRLSDGTEGWGEGVPRDYVTGEQSGSAASRIADQYAPRFAGLDVCKPEAVLSALAETFTELGLERRASGASWCALELAILDAVARARRLNVADWLGPARRAGVYYGAVVPFCGQRAFWAVLAFYKFYGFRTVKVKVGRDLDQDVKRIELARRFLGPAVVLRVDANCAWSAEQALEAAERMRPFAVASYEQPVPADDIAGLRRISESIPEEVVVDESLCTLEQARTLIGERACRGFNVRVSKVGGLLAARRMVDLARRSGLSVHLGAQVGETGILSAAARTLAVIEDPMSNYEGSDNTFLLKKDLTSEDLTVGLKGYGRLLSGYGFAVTVRPDRLAELAVTASELPSFTPAPST